MFAAYERQIAWRYLRSARSEGGVSTMTWISLVGISLAVFALIATLAVRSGFRAEFVDTVIGANAHIVIRTSGRMGPDGRIDYALYDYEAIADIAADHPEVVRAVPTLKRIVLGSVEGRNAAVEIFGQAPEAVAALEFEVEGSMELAADIAIGAGLARRVIGRVGDPISVTTPNAVQGPFGRVPRTDIYPIAGIFDSGRYEINEGRAYLPLGQAQRFFSAADAVDEIQIALTDPERATAVARDLAASLPASVWLYTWQDLNERYLQALRTEDRVMFILLSFLVLIAALNIVSGLIMLVKNKGRDIGILRTMGLTEGAILRVFFLCGASVGIIGTAVGTVLGCLFAVFFDQIFAGLDYVLSGGLWDPEKYGGVLQLKARLELADVVAAAGLSLFLSFVITWFPARRAARLDPVEALRNG